MPLDRPPLLVPGMHSMTLSELHEVVVEDTRFRISKTRTMLMKNLWTLCACLDRCGITGELRVDGSFLTEKIDPRDTDVVLSVDEGLDQSATAEQRVVLRWWVNREHDPTDPKTQFSS